MIYRIYPPIGIARLGNCETEYFIASESPNSKGTDVGQDGSETELTDFKTGDTGDPNTSFKVKKQAARFRIYEFDEVNSVGRPAIFPAGSLIRWSVQLMNKKDAVIRDIKPPAVAPEKVEIDPDRENRIIDAGTKTLDSNDLSISKPMVGNYLGHEVKLGELKLDKDGNLLVLGGSGISRTFEGAQIGASFYKNPGWHDDVSDGPITAIVVTPQGELHVQAAWVVVAPPDFAPGVKGVVTLFDVIRQAAKNASVIEINPKPSFTNDILPLICRATNLQWVHDDVSWMKISDDFATLADPSMTGTPKIRRTNTARLIRASETVFDHDDYNFNLCQWQNDYLDLYIKGGDNFESDFGTAVTVDPASPAVLTKTILDGTVGEGLFPGIEAGRIVTNINLYSKPFTFHLDNSKLSAGDLTALMAQPWQADFKKCSIGWWPSQRPNQAPGQSPRPIWERGLITHQDFVDHVMKLGVITEKINASGQTIQEESGRSPLLTEEVES